MSLNEMQWHGNLFLSRAGTGYGVMNSSTAAVADGGIAFSKKYSVARFVDWKIFSNTH